MVYGMLCYVITEGWRYFLSFETIFDFYILIQYNSWDIFFGDRNRLFNVNFNWFWLKSPDRIWSCMVFCRRSPTWCYEEHDGPRFPSLPPPSMCFMIWLWFKIMSTPPAQHVIKRWSMMVDKMLQDLIIYEYFARGGVAIFTRQKDNHGANRDPWIRSIRGPKIRRGKVSHRISELRCRRHGVFTDIPKISPVL